MEDIYGDVGKSPILAAKFGDALNALWRDGAAVTVKSYLHTS
jgi:mannitol 2-dehydrogenase